MTKTTREIEDREHLYFFIAGIVISIILSQHLMIWFLASHEHQEHQDLAHKICHNETYFEPLNVTEKEFYDMIKNTRIPSEYYFVSINGSVVSYETKEVCEIK